MPVEDPCEFLEWDSSFFGLRIARVAGDSLAAERVGEIETWCERHRIDCLYFLARLDDPATVRLAELNRYRLVDVRVTLELDAGARIPLPPLAGDRIRIRPASADDTGPLGEIACRSHRDTRFYADRNFPRDSSDLLYATWIERSVAGYAERVLVAEAGGRAVGYVTCHLKSGKADGEIGLLGVDVEERGQGIGPRLISEAAAWLAERGARVVKVTTQGRNVVAQRMYQRRGFVTASIGLWYHRWFR